jgi:transketolase
MSGTAASSTAPIASRDRSLDRDCANAIRALAMDAIQQANSGHPGMPMGMAEIAVALWQGALRHNPANPHWANRDRFVLSNGHGSMLLYSLLHLTGYDLPIEELKRFRQLHSRTPGHPEVGVTPGVETTTGPLGQGIANAVGMALAERVLAETFNRPGHTIVDHHTYAFLGDGCMMEGISHEAASLAGTWQLGKLIAFYDDNGISIDGPVSGWLTDDVVRRFQAYGWHVIPDVDGHDVVAVERALAFARAHTAQPSLIVCRTVIGKGSPNRQGLAKSHGEPLGKDEIAATREAIGWPHGPFEIPPQVRTRWDARHAGAAAEHAWVQAFEHYRAAHPELAAEFLRRTGGHLPDTLRADAAAITRAMHGKGETIATRKASQAFIEALAPRLPEWLGGSADLAGSVFTNWSGSRAITGASQDGAPGNFVNYGVREFAMAAISNGIALHGGFVPYSGTFLTFSDYSRNALRMASLMRIRNIFVFTHDSIGLGEDGPTHQPIEQVASLRLMPGMDVWRPCDTVETAIAWTAALERRDGPSCLILSRQNLPFQKRSEAALADAARGGYVLAPAEGHERAVLIATGSEIDVAMKAREALAAEGIAVRVVSMPCCEAFDRQDAAWRTSVLPAHLPRVAVEAGVGDGWRKYVGLEGAVVSIDRFGESAPAKDLFVHFGITAEHVVRAVHSIINQGEKQS